MILWHCYESSIDFEAALSCPAPSGTLLESSKCNQGLPESSPRLVTAAPLKSNSTQGHPDRVHSAPSHKTRNNGKWRCTEGNKRIVRNPRKRREQGTSSCKGSLVMSLYRVIILSSTRLLGIISGVNMCEVVGEAPASLVCLTSLALCLGYSCSPVCLL